MHITLVQTDIRWHAPRENMARIEALLGPPAPAPDGEPALIVLPEMWATGFDTQPDAAPALADAHDEALRWMRTTAQKCGAYVAGSLTARDGARLSNRLYLVAPDGGLQTYDKRHLFSYGGEQRAFSPGTDRVVATVGRWRVLLQICYDLRFPVFARNHGEYDLAVYVANWPESRQGAWDTLLRARAIENQCYVCGVNRCGSDALCRYAGGSALIDAYGRTVTEAGTAECAVTAVADSGSLQRFRHKFPVLEDADAFTLTSPGALPPQPPAL